MIMATILDFNRTPDSIAKNQRAPVPTGNSYARVPVVEDDEDMRFMLKTLLERRDDENFAEPSRGGAGGIRSDPTSAQSAAGNGYTGIVRLLQRVGAVKSFT